VNGIPYLDVEIERWLRVRRYWPMHSLYRNAPALARRIVDEMPMAELESLDARLKAAGFSSVTAYVDASIDRLRGVRGVSTVSGGLPTLGRGHR
jgi:hypothetical protein